MLPDRRTGRFLGGVLCLLLIVSLFKPSAEAANLTQAMVRLDRLASNTSLSGLVCATPSAAAAGTEGQVKVTFPSDFSLSTTTGNWTTGTTNLPSGATAWPGISATAQSVSGTTITFSSNDLTSGSANYCFTFTATSSTTGSTGAKTGTLTTATAGGIVIDSREYGMTVTDDRIRITATVPGQPTDYIATLTKLTAGSTFRQGTTIDYQILYGSTLPFATADLIVEASWSLGTISGANTPTVEVIDYEIGSASTGRGGTIPVVDLTNRTITWNIGQYPANGTDTVHFRIRTNDSYTGSSPVSFSVSARTLATGTSTTNSTVTSQYLYDYNPPGTSGPTATPAPVAPTPQASPVPFAIQQVRMRSIATNTAGIETTLSSPGTLTLMYGTSPRSLTKRITSLNSTRTHTLELSELSPRTQYYFRVTALNEAGQRQSSDLFTFTSADNTPPPKINFDSFIVTSQSNLLYTFLDKHAIGTENFFIIPPETLFEAQFALKDNPLVKELSLSVQPKQVLGLNTFTRPVEAASDRAPVIQTKPGVYAGRMQSKPHPGYYELFVRVNDYNGNISEEKLADIKVSRKFLVLSEDNNDPVEGARLTLSLFDIGKKIYTPISSQLIPIQNPVRTDPNGAVPIVLPVGKYRVEVEAIGFKKKTVDFQIGMNPDEDYPTIHVEKLPFSLFTVFQYLLMTLTDLGHSLANFSFDIGESRRMYHLVGFIITASFIFITLVSLSHRIHVRISHFPRYFHSLLRHQRGETDVKAAYRGIIRDARTKKPLNHVTVIISDVETGRVVLQTASSTAGKFVMTLPEKYLYLITLEAIGYHPVTLHLHHLKKGEEQQFVLMETEPALGYREFLTRLYHTTLNFSFEILLLLSLTASILLSFTIGFLPTVPLLIFAVFNLVFWGLHEVHRASS